MHIAYQCSKISKNFFLVHLKLCDQSAFHRQPITEIQRVKRDEGKMSKLERIFRLVESVAYSHILLLQVTLEEGEGSEECEGEGDGGM